MNFFYFGKSTCVQHQYEKQAVKQAILQTDFTTTRRIVFHLLQRIKNKPAAWRNAPEDKV